MSRGIGPSSRTEARGIEAWIPRCGGVVEGAAQTLSKSGRGRGTHSERLNGRVGCRAGEREPGRDRQAADCGGGSRALNGKTKVLPATRDRVLAAARQLDYRPNGLGRALKSGRSRMVGVVARPAPKLTTVKQDAIQIGRNAAELLLDRIEGRVEALQPRTARVGCELVVRSSTGPAPA